MKNEEERDTGIVIEQFEDEVLIEVKRKGSCKNCSVNMLCMGNSEKVRFKVKKPSFSLSTGDEVYIEIAPGDRLFSSFILFIFPILTMVLFYFIIKGLLSLSEDTAIFGSLAGLLVSGIVIKIIDRKTSNKVMVKITELKSFAGTLNRKSHNNEEWRHPRG